MRFWEPPRSIEEFDALIFDFEIFFLRRERYPRSRSFSFCDDDDDDAEVELFTPISTRGDCSSGLS